MMIAFACGNVVSENKGSFSPVVFEEQEVGLLYDP